MFLYCVSVRHWACWSKSSHHSVYCSFIWHWWHKFFFLQNILQNFAMTHTPHKYWKWTNYPPANTLHTQLRCTRPNTQHTQSQYSNDMMIQHLVDWPCGSWLIFLCSVKHTLYKVSARTSYNNFCLTL